MQKKIAKKMVKARESFEQGDYVECTRACKAVLRNAPNQKDCLNLLGVIALREGRIEDAIVIFEKLSLLASTNPLYLHNTGLCYQRLGDHSKAIEYFEAALQISPDFSEASNEICNSCCALNLPDEAIAHGLQACRLSPDNGIVHNNLGRAYEMASDFTRAESCYEKAVQTDPDNPVFRKNLAIMQINRGERDDARDNLSHALAHRPDYGEAWLHLSHINESGDDNQDLVSSLERKLQYADRNAPNTADMHFALAKALDSAGMYDLAFEHYDAGNRIYHTTYDFSIRQHEDLVDSIIDSFSSDLVHERLPDDRLWRWQPIFIVGMPRSGTSLVEQILASHSDVHGCGELTWFKQLENDLSAVDDGRAAYPECIREMQPADLRELATGYENTIGNLMNDESAFTDKLPDNYTRIGLISSMLPGARFIYTTRNPMATCFSIYQQRFAGSIHWGYDLETIGAYYCQQRRLQSHWLNTLEHRIFLLEYENLVDDLSEVTGKMLEFLGLEWDDACVSFYNTQRHTHTASDTQVSRPLYKHAMDHWKNYVNHLGDLEKELSKCIRM